MSALDSRLQRARRRLGPLTRRVPYGHVASEGATYARLLVPGLPRPTTRFVVFAQGRSGSTLLTELLNSHPRVYCADEILTWKRRDPLRYASACSVGHRADTYGFKVKVYQLTDAQLMSRPGDFLRAAHEDGWKLLALQRRNVLRQALSASVAAQRQVYHERHGAQSAAPVRVDPQELLRDTDRRVAFCEQEAAALAGLPHLSLSYEDDLLRPESHQPTASRVFAYLGLEDAPVTTRIRKISDKALEQVVANADEVRAAVAASPYASMLEQD